MNLYMKLALWIFFSSALVAVINSLAAQTFQDWGGDPSFGWSGIQSLAYIGMIVGVSFFIAALVQRRRHRRSQ